MARKSKDSTMLYIIMAIVGVLIIALIYKGTRENMGGYGVLSDLAFNNSGARYCIPEDPAIGYSGGCFSATRV